MARALPAAEEQGRANEARCSDAQGRGQRHGGERRVMTTITEAFELPRPEDIRAMGFVVRLREADPESDEVKQLVHDYVITPAVEKELPTILDTMKQVF